MTLRGDQRTDGHLGSAIKLAHRWFSSAVLLDHTKAWPRVKISLGNPHEGLGDPPEKILTRLGITKKAMQVRGELQWSTRRWRPRHPTHWTIRKADMWTLKIHSERSGFPEKCSEFRRKCIDTELIQVWIFRKNGFYLFRRAIIS